MNSEQEHRRVLDELLAGVDMANEVAKKQAYNRCREYAQDELADDANVNSFMAMASERLGQTRIHFRVVESMVQMPEDARLHLTYTEEDGPCLTGNSSGLRYLSDLAAALSSAPSPHEHVHLYQETPPMFGNSFALTLYNEPDEWLDQHGIAPDDANTNGTTDDTTEPPRETAVDSIAAIEFFEGQPLPPPFLFSFDKLYRVVKSRPYSGEKVWAKKIGLEKGTARVHIFSIHDDSGALFDIALHLDDPDVRYFTRRDLEQVMPQRDVKIDAGQSGVKSGHENSDENEG